MNAVNYLDRCLRKADQLFKEITDEKGKHHVYKLIFAYWEAVEMLIRSILYKLKKTTYEKPGKLISVFLKLYTERFSENFDLFLAIRRLYAFRRRCVHTAHIINEKDLEKATKQFCIIISHLKNALEKLDLNVKELNRALKSCDTK